MLDGAVVGTLATVTPDGAPWVVPMLYARVDDVIILHGSTGAGALREVRNGAPAALSVIMLDGIVVADNLFNHSANYRSAVVHGTVHDVTDDVYALEAFSDVLVPGRSGEVRDMTRKERAATATCALTVDRWTVKVRDAPPSRPDTPEGWAGVVPLRTVTDAPIPADWIEGDTPVPDSVQKLVAEGASYLHAPQSAWR
ncbi:MAG: pyridoxamine 5'-phosphate oxidase family protein, partial [Rhodococcus sp.]|nr:pyridoxamine 5'-phosphate oxidase family protein [Rhodococcus sp. (in: high G+C Gram-positive bacteria)]